MDGLPKAVPHDLHTRTKIFDVDCGINVSIIAVTAAHANKYSLRSTVLLAHIAAVRASPTCVARINLDKEAPLRCELVGEFLQKTTKSHIQQGAL